LRIEALEKGRPPVALPDAAAGLETLLRVLKDRVEEVAEALPRATTALAEEADVKEMVLEEIRVSEVAVRPEKPKEKEGRNALRKGAEGDDVRAMQEALEKFGFYSGEEDMEFSVFSSGTERAVKTWQASSGAIEDGIMTSELLGRLFMELEAREADGANGTAGTSMTNFTDIQQTVIKDDGVTGVEVSQQRVFLLGENRWEEPSRLVGRESLVGNKAVSTRKCLSCRGEGRLMCTECDGTGEPNIEPQFLEWVDEGAKCPYCEGLGYTVCDVCEGKTAV
ncbi:hypothetical protein Taro_055355, partial [Colocasia esculenta]|nr:hypothetical protein [Colocasia esculenta]